MPRYPESHRSDVEDVLHGTAVPDPYRWLEDLDAPETAAWVAQQNALTECWLADVPERAELRRRVAELWDHPRSSPPWRRGERWFQLRNTGLQDQDVLWVVDDPDDADARFSGGRVLLDPGELSPDGTAPLSATVPSGDSSPGSSSTRPPEKRASASSGSSTTQSTSWSCSPVLRSWNQRSPWRRGERWFQLRNTGLQDQDVLWVVDDPDDADARFSGGRVLLDPGELSADGTVALSGAVVSEDGELLAYATSAAGSDWMTWRVRRVIQS